MATESELEDTEREIFPTLGFTADEVDALLRAATVTSGVTRTSSPTPTSATFAVDGASLRVEHHPGHTPGHVWLVDETSGAIFVGDYVIANHPTNAGLERDARPPDRPRAAAGAVQRRASRAHDSGERRPCSRRTDPRSPTTRRYRESACARPTAGRETCSKALRDAGPMTPSRSGGSCTATGSTTNWEVVADLIGRLDLLCRRRASDRPHGGRWGLVLPSRH